MTISKRNTKTSAPLSTKVVASLIAGLLFFIVSQPTVYKLTDSAAKKISSQANLYQQGPTCGPTTSGIAVHSAVFALLTFLLMEL